jgi:YNFM family putative membrane transporter
MPSSTNPPAAGARRDHRARCAAGRRVARSAAYLRIALALFLAGFATFSLYCVQPLLPAFVREFHVGAASSSLSLSLSTGMLAVSILCAGALSGRVGRRGPMFASMTLAALFNLLAAVAPSWHLLLAWRALEGFALGGVPAVAMAYLAEEIAPEGLGLSMGLYVGGTAFGGMIGGSG